MLLRHLQRLVETSDRPDTLVIELGKHILQEECYLVLDQQNAQPGRAARRLFVSGHRYSFLVGSGISMVQTRPLGAKSSSVLPSSSNDKPRSISIDPNPLYAVFCTGGPLVSAHFSWSTLGFEYLKISHVTRTRPAGIDNDPYFAAFVASSWKTRPSASAAFGAT